MNWFTTIVTILILYLFALEFFLTNGEFYSSVPKLMEIMDLEVKMLKNMEHFIEKNEMKLEFLKERLLEYENEHDEIAASDKEYPVNNFLLNKRLNNDWEHIQVLLQHKQGKDILPKIEQNFIEDAELEGALEGVLRIQDIYRLNATDIARGLLQGVQYNAQFQSQHCYDLGKRALDTNLPKLAYAWFSEALKRLTADDVSGKLDIELGLVQAMQSLGDLDGANRTLTNLMNSNADNEKLIKVVAEFNTFAEGKVSMDVDYKTEHKPVPDDIYRAPRSDLFKYTCAGLLKLNPEDERDLRCGFLTESHPFLILAPIKVEELHYDPLLVIYHDVLYDKEIETLKKLVNATARATVMSPKGGVVSKVRTSQVKFLPTEDHPVLSTIDQRVEDMTSLNMKFAEPHQFATYGIGGHYGEHHDYFSLSRSNTQRKCQFEWGDRIATVLFYLSDVKQGGGTAFPYLEQLAMPKKGSAIFWFNLHASGISDERTLHGACPIIVGSKWVQNRWIREYGQEASRPCHTFNDALL